MKSWYCADKKCKTFNVEETSIVCNKCHAPRPFNSLPKDLVFPVYLPLNDNIKLNAQAKIFSQLLYVIPTISAKEESFENMLKLIRKKEKVATNCDFNKIKVIDLFLEHRALQIANEKLKHPD